MVEQQRAGRLSHFATDFGAGSDSTAPGTAAPDSTAPDSTAPEIEVAGAQPATRRPALALTAEGPRRADLIAWASANRATLARLRLLAPAGIGALLTEHVGLTAEPLRSGTVGPAATAGLAAAGDIDAMVAFADPIELRPGDTTTRSLTRLAVFWDIPIAGNRATADLLLASVIAASTVPADLAEPLAEHPAPASGAVKLWTVRATVEDVPGRLAILAASLARRAINILSVQVHLTSEGPVDELLVAASPVLSAADLTAAVVDGGARTPRVALADAHALVDAPTRALNLASRLVRVPGELATILTSLLPGATVTWQADAPAQEKGEIWLADPTGGGFVAARPDAPFTPAECARAYAMIDVATAALTNVPVVAQPRSWQLLLSGVSASEANGGGDANAGGGGNNGAANNGAANNGAANNGAANSAGGEIELTMRVATTDDLNAVMALHSRCSMTSRLRRYLAGTRGPSEVAISKLLAAGQCLVVEEADGTIRAMGNLAETDDRYPEIALLVEDSWQHRRLGTLLARRLAADAAEAGAKGVKSVVHSNNAAMLRIMSTIGHRLHREYDGGLLTLIATVGPDGGAHTQRFPSHMRLSQSG